MKKKAEDKKYELSHFFTKSNHETPSKMDLLLDGEPTGHYLMVIGSESRSVQRAKITAQVEYADIDEQAEKVKDKVEQLEFIKEKREAANISYAMHLVKGWSFGEFDELKLVELFTENQGLALSVIGHAATTKNYALKSSAC